jgi:phospholipid-binding lipoprotein MlaA
MTADSSLRRADHPTLRPAFWAGVFLMCLSLIGCATGPNANPHDPLEPFNRGVYHFNEVVDKAVLKPVASVYRDALPDRVRQGIGNFFNNLGDVWSFVNNALQFKGQAAVDSLKRFGVNTFVGWGGIFDVASEMDIEKHTKDFGHTLGYWGVAPGPYLVLPLLGPSTFRDAVALPVDLKGDLVSNIHHIPTRNSATAVRAIDTRSDLLKASTMLEEAALDQYSFTRDAYLQRRSSVIYEGNPPEEANAEPESGQPVAGGQPLNENRAPTSPETSIDPGLTGNEKATP